MKNSRMKSYSTKMFNNVFFSSLSMKNCIDWLPKIVPTLAQNQPYLNRPQFLSKPPSH